MTTTLLAIDDSKTMRKVFEITFAGEDYQTILAGSADEAMNHVRQSAPRVALVDADLGGTSGYDLCQRIKAEAPQVAVIVMSSKQQPYDPARGGAAGADDHMDKPFDTQQLLDKVASVAAKPAAAPARPAAAAPAPAARPAPLQHAQATPAASQAPAQARPRTPTLSYGAPTPQTTPGSRPPVQPQPQPAPARTNTQVGSPAPAPVAPRQAASQPRPAAPAARPATTGAQPAAASAATGAASAATGGNGQFAEKLAGLGLDANQVNAVLALSREVVEQVVWEVVPTLAETLIKEEIHRLTKE